MPGFGDMVELRGERYHFVGRRGGIINIGGLKVHPEEVEAVINRHESVRTSRARSRTPIVLTKNGVRHMMADGAGRIVNISFIIASIGCNGLSVDAASKVAAGGFTRSLARQVGKLGIAVNAIAPGFVDPDFLMQGSTSYCAFPTDLR
jgi:3-oxoacyl-[acyl-carrier protein] reductase